MMEYVYHLMMEYVYHLSSLHHSNVEQVEFTLTFLTHTHAPATTQFNQGRI